MGGTSLSLSNSISRIYKTNGGSLITYLLRDEFTTPDASPITSPRTCEPGPGTLTVTDTSNYASISNDKLVYSNVVGSGDPSVRGPNIYVRSAGLALKTSVQTNNLGDRIMMGWGQDDSGLPLEEGLYFKTTGDIRTYTPSEWSIGSFAANTEYQIATVLRSQGMYYFIKGGAYTNWTLLWVSKVKTTSPLRPILAKVASAAGTSQIDYLRLANLPTPWDDDYGIVTQRLAGSQPDDTLFTHEANCLIEYTVTTMGGNGRFIFRVQDNTNYWRFDWSAGGIALYECVDNVTTGRGSAGFLTTDGTRYVITCDGTTIRVYANNVLYITYASATNFQTATGGKLDFLGLNVVSDIITWPRTISGDALTSLEAI